MSNEDCYPKAYFSADSTHDKNRILICFLCLNIITRKQWRDAKAKSKTLFIDENLNLKGKLREILPMLDPNARHSPASVCQNCFHYCNNQVHLQRYPKKILKAKEMYTARQQRSTQLCDSSCTICKKVLAHLEKSNRFKRKVKDHLSPPKRKKRKLKEIVKEGKLEIEDHLAMGAATGASGRAMGRGAAELRNRSAEGLTSVKSASSSAIRTTHSILNETFQRDFKTVECEHSTTDNAAILCENVCEFIEKLVWLMNKKPKDVALIKLNSDGGQGSVKLLLQVLRRLISCN
jgi:hypothetical protein